MNSPLCTLLPATFYGTDTLGRTSFPEASLLIGLTDAFIHTAHVSANSVRGPGDKMVRLSSPGPLEFAVYGGRLVSSG